MCLMRKSLFIKNAAMTTDVLLYLKKLSLFFQKPDINVADAQDVLLTIKNFNPDPVIHLWQQAAIWGWRPNQKIWKKTKQSRHSGVTESDSDATSDISENCESDSKYSSDESSISPPAVESDQWCNARYQYIKWDWTAFG